LPLLLIWRSGLLQDESAAWLAAPLIASAYGFCQTDAKTDDGYFLGFPSYWNIIAFYLYALQPPAWVVIATVLLFAVLTFVPSRYLYPSQRGRLNLWTNVFGAFWAILMLWIVWNLPQDAAPSADALMLISLVFPAYYLLVSWTISARIFARACRQHRHGARDIHT
jgi:phosphatidylcholine synthase